MLTEPIAGVAPSEDRRAASVRLHAVGTAVPDICWAQQEMAQRLAALWALEGVALDRWNRIVAGSGIDRRHGVMHPEQVMTLTTAQRMLAYEDFAPPLAARAASRAIDAAGFEAERVTDVVVVSCTGFSAPGLDVALIERLGLRKSTRRTIVGFMGCFGAINGLRVASGLCAADPGAVVLLVCAELCSLHVRDDREPQNQVACALFADGAAAAILSSAPIECQPSGRQATSTCIGLVGDGRSMLLPEGRRWMTWRITDAGFAMTLTRDVPSALRASVVQFVRAGNGNAMSENDIRYIVHPGGPGVLDAVDAALKLRGGRGLDCSRRVLREYGNMSSATVLFALKDAVRHDLRPPFHLLAFGPGLTIEGIAILDPASR